LAIKKRHNSESQLRHEVEDDRNELGEKKRASNSIDLLKRAMHRFSIAKRLDSYRVSPMDSDDDMGGSASAAADYDDSGDESDSDESGENGSVYEGDDDKRRKRTIARKKRIVSRALALMKKRNVVRRESKRFRHIY
jgi:hypothetical protein